ncbi:40S ribosomal protein S27 [Entophlyctis luteolus]|nr:40S ribosomal protein S27 [Entophlyctis luteolus]
MLADPMDDDGSHTAPADIADVDDIALLTAAWMNERAAPALLPFQHGPLARLREMIAVQEETLDSMESEDVTDADFIRSVCLLELDRVKFVIQAYLRTRLHKAEQKTMAILDSTDSRMCLSDAELAYAERFNDIVNESYQQAFLLDSLPPSLQSLNDPEIIGSLDLQKAVFVRVQKDIGDLLLPNGDTIDMAKGKMYLLRYNLVKDMLAIDLLNPLESSEKRSHKLKRLVQSPNSFFMDVKCSGCFQITTVFSHAQTVVICGGCATVLSQPTGGRARLTEGSSYRRKQN